MKAHPLDLPKEIKNKRRCTQKKEYEHNRNIYQATLTHHCIIQYLYPIGVYRVQESEL